MDHMKIFRLLELSGYPVARYQSFYCSYVHACVKCILCYVHMKLKAEMQVSAFELYHVEDTSDSYFDMGLHNT
jgi:hypothetical protein